MTLTIISDLRKQMDDAAKVVEKVQAEMRESGRQALEPAFTQFFADNPEVEVIRWAQYTPYFNDGDDLIFKVREMQAQFTDDFRSKYMVDYFDPDEVEDQKWYEGDIWYISKDSVEGQASLKRFKEFVAEINDKELLKAIFGDHVRIEATRKGLNVRHHDHE